jgi:hypothetical protein
MHAMRALFLIFAMLMFAPGITAQTIQSCTQISIDSVEKIDPGVALVFLAKHDTTLGEVKYKWTISAGTIVSGQDTSSISVDTTGLGGQALTATVEVIGREWTCSVRSKPVEIAPPPIVCGLAFDEYGDIKWEDEMARLDNFAIQLMNQPSSRGALITYAGNPTYKGEAAFKLRRATDYLVNIRKIPRERLITTDAGYRTDLTTKLYIVPEGATLPASDPYGLLPLSEVRFTKPKPHVNRKSTPRRRIN